MKYLVEITETLQKTVEIEAENEREAILGVKQLYYDDVYELDYESFINVEFGVINLYNDNTKNLDDQL